MSHKKAGGSSRNGRDSNAQRLGIKIHDGQAIKPGMIIVRQRGTRVHPGENVKKGVDDTLFSTAFGVVKFIRRKRPGFDGRTREIRVAKVVVAAA